jgi:PIN domain nuclease of toxin-antitoxin system
MSLLLDTHALIWFALGEELSPKTVGLIDEKRHTADLYVSAVTAWELGFLFQRQFQRLGSLPDWWQTAKAKIGFRVLPISDRISIRSHDLWDWKHADPADRLIVASACEQDWTLVTRDLKIIALASRGHFRVEVC